MYLVLDVILHDCTTPADISISLSTLPTKLEDAYRVCMFRTRDRRFLCNFKLLLTVCAATRPMHEQALRQLLALDKVTFDFIEEDMISTEDLVQSGVGLVTLDVTEQVMIPVHDSVRGFVFSDRGFVFSDTARTVLDEMEFYHHPTAHARELAAKNNLGFLCLQHIKTKTTRSIIAAAEPTHLKVPMRALNFSKNVQRALGVVLPRAAGRTTIDLKLPAQRHRAPIEKGFLQYAIANWIECNRDLDLRGSVSKDHRTLFADIAMDRNESWNLHPWSSHSSTQHRVGMFAFSVTNGNIPLLELVLGDRKNLPKGIFDGLLPSHGQLPALHVACKMGRPDVVNRILPFCDPTVRCQQQRRLALHYAAENGSLECVTLVLQLTRTGPRSENHEDAQDRYGCTALHVAAQNGHEEVVSYLSRHSALTRSVPYDFNGLSPATYALQRGHFHLFPLLVNTENSDLHPILSNYDLTPHLDNSVPEDEILDPERHPCLAERVANRIAVLYLQGGPNTRDDDGLTALWYASSIGFNAVVKHLVALPDLDQENELIVKGPEGDTALGIAIKRCHLDVVQTLSGTSLATQFAYSVSCGWLPIECLAFIYECLPYCHEETRRDFATGHVSMSTKQVRFENMAKSEVDLVLNNSDKIELAYKLLGQVAFATTGDHTGDLEASLQAASEVGHADAVKHLLAIWKNLGTSDHLSPPANFSTAEKYIQKRGLDREDFLALGVDDMRFPVATFLAAVKHHKDVLDLLLQDEDEPYNAMMLMLRAQTLRSFPRSLTINAIQSGLGGWFPKGMDSHGDWTSYSV